VKVSLISFLEIKEATVKKWHIKVGDNVDVFYFLL